ncbi:kinesin-related [Holotrichia oblita]|uniref:Kinesin-related n=1 Tax=Holotrichia oblita TaxID=644536 RepID=A0ACB9TKE3_HOLOL|nr:kinesin-related [Holotrichia oblita]
MSITILITTNLPSQVFNIIDNVVGDAVKKKFHSCILAYGQSSSGKTHTMMGFNDDPGLTPRLCEKIFAYLKGSDIDEEDVNNVTLSYLEIYNEKVNDLLATANSESSSTRRPILQNLKVREHPTRGTYVQGLTERRVTDSETLLEWLEIGNTRRRVSATSINSRSSRSHSVVTIKCLGGVKLSLVDLAGSERTGSRTYTTSTFREGANINKSLVALGNVVTALADQSSKYSRGFKKRFVPYRDSVLTWLLKDTLGGNSQTVMIATISSSSICYNETVNTLRFGHRAKQIIAQPLVNEDPKQKIIRDLKGEVVRLKELLTYHKISHNIIQDNQEIEGQIEETNNLFNSQDRIQKFVETVDISTNTEEEFFLKRDLIPYFSHTFSCDELKEFFGNTLIDLQKNSIIDKINLSWDNCQSNISNEFGIELLKDINAESLHFLIKSLIKTTGTDFISYQDKKFDLSKNNSIDNLRTNIWKLDLSKDSNILYQKTEKLIPVMDVTTNSNIEKPIVKLRRTYSVCSDMDGLDSIRKVPGKPRSEIVAAVTQRLYTKAKKKEIATETDEITKENKSTMARPRLQDITQRAIRYYKRRHMETQTEADPVMRVKDISTDVEDLKLDLLVVKHANIATDITRNRDTGNEAKSAKSNSTSPIYTSSVNINVSHNYINGNNTENTITKAGSISGDSLDDQNLQNLCFPTPDLLSNHSSLEQQQSAQELSAIKDKDELNYAVSDDIPVEYNMNEEFESNFGESCNARYSLVPQLIEQVDVGIPPVYAPEIHLIKKSERCNFLNNSQPKLCKPNIIQENNNFGATITVKEPQILKSIMKHNNLHCEQQYSSDSESTDISADTFDNVPDSLNYHINKKVRFPEERVKDGHMFEAMTNFLKEATNLMSNLSIVANKLDRTSEEGYEMQVTISDINKVLPCKQRKRYKKKFTNKKPECVCVDNTYYESTSCQTTPKKTTNKCTETDIPINKFEASVRDACDRLEQYTNRISKRSERTPSEESTLHRFPQPFSVTDWNEFSSLQPEDSSLESNPTYSDYGSLPRRKVKHKSLLTPSAYLKQLTNMRKHIIDTARDELVQEPMSNIE